MPDGFTDFDTPIGRCSISWGPNGIVGVRLPGRRSPASASDTIPSSVRSATDGIVRLLQGESVDLSDVQLDMANVPALHQRVYEVARSVPPGSTITYGDIAKRLGDHGLAREVGQALAKNPFAIVVPCHRVVASNGKLGGFSAPGGLKTKQRMLAIEGVGTLPMFA